MHVCIDMKVQVVALACIQIVSTETGKTRCIPKVKPHPLAGMIQWWQMGIIRMINTFLFVRLLPMHY